MRQKWLQCSGRVSLCYNGAVRSYDRSFPEEVQRGKQNGVMA